MIELKSSFHTWRYILRAAGKRRSVDHYLPVILSAAGSLGVLPFAVIRFRNGEWLAGLIDTAIILGLLGFGTFVYVTRNVRYSSYAISTICVGGALATVYINGPQQVFWVFPAILAVFYMVRPIEGVIFGLITIFALLPALETLGGAFETLTILVAILVTGALAFAFSIITNRQRQQLMHLATRDPLTGVGNRRALSNKLREVVNMFKRAGSPVSMLLMDLDHFKKVNDAHGHAAGDEILKQITKIIKLRIRVTDSLYRIGGEEFVIVLEGQDLQRASHLAEQLRTIVEANELVPNQAVTISVGVAELKTGETGNDWIQRADEALYRAKRSGRNALSIAE